MNFSSENELTKSMRLYAILAALFLISTLSIIFAFVFFILFLIKKSILGCIICFLICGLLIITVLMILRRYKKEEAEPIHNPYEIILPRKFSYKEIKEILLERAKSSKCRDFQKDCAFFCFLKMKYKNRILLVGTTQFEKSNFNSTKKKINKAVNKEFNVRQSVSAYEANKMMRINIIAADEINEPLYAFLSNNACTLLKRNEGIINFAVAGDRLIIPPFFGDNNLKEIERFIKSTADIKNLLK